MSGFSCRDVKIVNRLTLLLATILLLAGGCATQRERRMDAECERKYGPPMRLGQVEKLAPTFKVPTISGRKRIRTSAGLIGRWKGEFVSEHMYFRQSKVDGCYRKSSHTLPFRYRYEFVFSADGRFRREGSFSSNGKPFRPINVMEGHWTFEDGILTMMMQKDKQSSFEVYALAEGSIELVGDWSDGKSGFTNRTDEFGCYRNIKPMQNGVRVWLRAPQVLQRVGLSDEAGGTVAPINDVSASRRKDLHDLKNAGIITEEEYETEMRKLEGAGK